MTAQKVCRVCGRRFSWRRKWAGCWERVRHCSTACRRRGLRPLDRQIERELLALLRQRPVGSSLCAGELARRVARHGQAWRHLLEPVRMAARRLQHAGEVEILQSGRRVDPDTVRGPMHIRLARHAPASGPGVLEQLR